MSERSPAQMSYIAELKPKLEACPHGKAGELIERAAAFLCVSKQKVYELLRAGGYQSGRKTRSDRGTSKLDKKAIESISGIARASRRSTGKQLLSIRSAIGIAQANELSIAASPATALRQMRKHGCHPRQLDRPEPHVTMRSLHPNHVWQLDASLCVLYYLRDGRVDLMDERKVNARKVNDIVATAKQRVLRYVVTDHCSGAFKCRYYLTSGEDQATLFEFLMYAFGKQDGGLMHGVPLMLVWDAGAANQAHAIGSLLDQLQIRHWAHVPGNPRAKGQVESSHNVVERDFEGRLRFMRTESIEDLNGHLDRWERVYNATEVMRRHGHTRWSVWQTIRQDQLRIRPSIELCRDAMNSRPVERHVRGDLTVSLAVPGHGKLYYDVSRIPDVRVGEPLTVQVNWYRSPSMLVVEKAEDGTARYIECEPLEFTPFGFRSDAPVFGETYAAAPDTVADSKRKDLNQAAYGKRDERDAVAAMMKKGSIAYGGAIDPMAGFDQKLANAPSFIERRGTPLEMPATFPRLEPKPIELMPALRALRRHLGRDIAIEENQRLANVIAQGVTEDELPALLENLFPLQSAPRLQIVR